MRLRVVKSLVVIAIVSASTRAASFNEDPNQAVNMPCHTLEPASALDEKTRLEKLPVYVPEEKDRAKVEFLFNLDRSTIGDSVFVIYSNRARSALYRGAYQAKVVVQIDHRLAHDDGYDDVEFRLLQLKDRRFCIWVNEQGAPFWQAGASVEVHFLQAPTLDKDGLPKRFDVIIK